MPWLLWRDLLETFQAWRETSSQHFLEFVVMISKKPLRGTSVSRRIPINLRVAVHPHSPTRWDAELRSLDLRPVNHLPRRMPRDKCSRHSARIKLGKKKVMAYAPERRPKSKSVKGSRAEPAVKKKPACKR